MTKAKPETVYDPDAPAPTETVRKAAPAKAKTKAEPADQRLPVQAGNEHLTADAEIVLDTKNDADQLNKDIARIRKLRKPFGAFSQKLAIDERPGYKRHWFNDSPGRIDQAKANGWEHVKDKQGRPVQIVVGTGRDKGALLAYAMELPKVFWDQDMAARHAEAKARMDGIKKNPFPSAPGSAKASDRDKFYSPGDEVVTMRTPE